MKTRLAIGLVVATIIGCFRGTVPASPAERPVELNLSVGTDESFASAEIVLSAEDGGRLATYELDAGNELVSARDWYRGPGVYAVSMRFSRRDGGTAVHSIPFELMPNDREVSGWVFVTGSSEHPTAHLELIERTPAGLTLEPASTLSREGHAAYVLSNATARALQPDYFGLRTEQRSERGWLNAATAECGAHSDESIEPGARRMFDSQSSACLNDPLQKGRYRHVLRLERRSSHQWNEVTRAIELAREFDAQSVEPSSHHAFQEVPVSQLRSGWWSGNGGRIYGPDGGSACVCHGSVVGKERLRAVKGVSGVCLTADLDASVVVCEPLEGGEDVGDHPPFPFR